MLLALGTLALLLSSASFSLFANDRAFLTLAPFEAGVLDGSEPFALTDDCAAAGDDCGPSDGRVRTNDTLEFSWSVTAGGLQTASSPDQPGARINSVMFEQT